MSLEDGSSGARDRAAADDRLAELDAVWQLPGAAIVVVDGALTIRRANAAFGVFVGEPKAPLAGRPLRGLVPILVGPLAAIVRSALESGEPASNVHVPYNFAELAVDAIPVGVGGPDARVVLSIADTRRRPLAAPEGASGARMRFFEIARRMARATRPEFPDAVMAALRFAAETYDLERAYVRLLDGDGVAYTTAYEVHRPELTPLAPREVTAASIAWAHERFLRGEVVVLSSPDDLPHDDKGFRAALQRVGVSATISVPVVHGHRLLGYVAYPALEGRAWSRAEVDLLALLGEMIASLVARGQAEQDLEDRLQFERILSDTARRFVGVSDEGFDEAMARTLAAFGEGRALLHALVVIAGDAEDLSAPYEWHAEGAPPLGPSLASPLARAPSFLRRALGGETASSRADTSPDAPTAEILARAGSATIIASPIHVDGRVAGALVLTSREHRRGDPGPRERRTEIGADVIGTAFAQRAARERARRYDRMIAQVLASAMDGVAIVDLEGTVKEWTPRAETVLGRTRGEMLGVPLATLVHGDDRTRLATRIAEARASSGGATRFELRATTPSGRTLVLELSMTRLDGDVPLVAAFLRDVTDQKRAEAEKARAFDEVTQKAKSAERERDYLRQERRPSHILGESAVLRQALNLCYAVAETDSSVLLLGESGVGKELFAAAVHERSGRAGGPFVKVNCASVPGTLFESEFFGHAKGSFTGAVKDRAGRFELADGGTLFLDEVGEIPIELQSKLLRVLQEGEVERIGEDRTRRLDVRIVAATNRDLATEVEAGRFRGDLYFRLGVFPISIPPLRARGDDVVILARHFLRERAREARRTGLTLTTRDEERIATYDWPGNVRELEHVIERAVILSRTPPLRLDLALPDRAPTRSIVPSQGPELLREEDMRRLERDNLVAALRRAQGRVSGPGGAAELLGMNPSTLRDRMKAFRIQRDE